MEDVLGVKNTSGQMCMREKWSEQELQSYETAVKD